MVQYIVTTRTATGAPGEQIKVRTFREDGPRRLSREPCSLDVLLAHHFSEQGQRLVSMNSRVICVTHRRQARREALQATCMPQRIRRRLCVRHGLTIVLQCVLEVPRLGREKIGKKKKDQRRGTGARDFGGILRSAPFAENGQQLI